MNRFVAAVSVVAAALAFAGCGASQGASSAGPAPTMATETVTSPTATEPAQSTPKPELEDGRHFGYIESVDLGSQPATLTFDLAYFLGGEEANREAERRGFETPVPNDYFIVNDNPMLRTLRLAGDVQLRLLDWTHCCNTFFTGDLERFAASFEQTEHSAANYRGTVSAYWLTVEDGLVVRVDEQYFP